MKIKTIDKLKQTEVNYYIKSEWSGHAKYVTTLFKFLTETSNKFKDKIDYLRKLNETNEKKAKQYKKESLPLVTISATFKQRRLVGDVKDRTGLIALDIDKDKNFGLNVDKAKDEIMKLPYVMYCSLSCRGEGIWVLIPYNVENSFNETFNALREDFKHIGYNIDNCGDITRLRCVSYDNDARYRKEVEVYERTVAQVKREYVESDWEMTKQDIKDLVVIIYVLVNFHSYHRDDYDEWLLEGFRLATCPNFEVGLKLFQMISEASIYTNPNKYKGPEDVREKFVECYNTTTYTTSILGYYFNLIKEIYGEDWRYRINELFKEKNIKI